MRFSLIVAACLWLPSLAAQADTFQLNYSAGYSYQHFVFDVSAPIAPMGAGVGTFYLNEVDSLSGNTYRLGFNQTGGYYTFGVGDQYLQVGDGFVSERYKSIDYAGFGSGILYTGPDTAPVFNVGSYSSPTLTITDLSTPTAIQPEPSSIALLATGMLGVAGVVRKRFV